MTRAYLWGVSASPYYLKMQALLARAGVDYRCLPQSASRLEAVRVLRRLRAARLARRIGKYPAGPSALDEYPAVPFYSLDGESLYYDSSALALHLDSLPNASPVPLVPTDPALAFLCHFLDEAFDEFGLYMVHHMRWVGAARSTRMGHRTARELRAVVPPGLTGLYARQLYRRQVRRCPYLFSVAPAGFECGVSAARTPPSRPGFPSTHALLEGAWREYLAAMEGLLARQPYLLGEYFTLADASAYGQLGMNLVDPEAAAQLQRHAPETYRWLRTIEAGEGLGGAGRLACSGDLLPLLDIVQRTFVPLMVRNARAYTESTGQGQALFNEAAFDRGEALYDGEILGQPYRAVVKSFQVQVWRDLQARWQSLPADALAAVGERLLPATIQALESGPDGSDPQVPVA